MKILLITLEYPPVHGGVASYYFGLVEELKRQGHEVEVIAQASADWHDPSPPPSPAGRGGLLLSRWIWPRWVRGYFTVRKALKNRSRDFLFVGQVLPLGAIAYLLRRRVPYVVFTHGMDVLMAQKSWRKRWLARKIFERAKLVVANSEFTKREIEKIENRKWKIEVLYPCPIISADVRTEDVDLLRRKLGLVGKRVMLTLGRVVERKGHDLVITALPEILAHVPEAIYVVAGEGPDLGRLQKLVADSPFGKGLSSTVRFVGAISDEDRPLYYALSDLFVMPSRQIGPDVEGFGLSFLEAAGFGKPSIGGRSGGVPEAILDGKTGALVDPNDSSALARVAVQLLRDDTLRHELGQNAKARAVHEFRWDKQVAGLVEVMKKVAREK